MALVVGLCFVLYLLRINLAIAAPVMEPSLGITDVQLGLAFAAFSWVYAICQVPAGIACEIAGPRRGMTTLVASWGVITLVTGLIPGTSILAAWLVISALVGIRAVLGVTQAAFFPTMQGTLLRWLPPGRWALATGQINAGYTLGGAAAGPLVAWLVLAFGWRLSFILTAPFALVLAGAWWWYFRDDPAQHPDVNTEELAVIGRGCAATVARVDWRRDLGLLGCRHARGRTSHCGSHWSHKHRLQRGGRAGLTRHADHWKPTGLGSGDRLVTHCSPRRPLCAGSGSPRIAS